MRTSSQTGVEGPGCFKHVQATRDINPLASFLLFKTVSVIVAPLWSQALQIHSIPSFPKMEHHIFALLASFSFTSSAFSLYHVHLLGVALGLALCLFLLLDEGSYAYNNLDLTECCAWLLLIEKHLVFYSYTLCLPNTGKGNQDREKFLSAGLDWLSSTHISTCILILHLSPGGTVASSAPCFFLALVF